MAKSKPLRQFSAIFLVLAVCFIVAILPNVSAFDWADGLPAYYKLDGTTGDVSDEINNYNGTNIGSIRGVPGKLNNAFNYNGTTDYVNLSYQVSDVSADKTVNIWINTTENGTSYLLAAYDGTDYQYFGRINSGRIGNIDFMGNTGATNAGVNFTSQTWRDGNWHMLTFVQNGATASNLEIYLDGVNQTTDIIGSGTYNTVAVSKNLFLGASNFDGTPLYFLNGTLDEIGIWNRSLSESEISELYNSGDGLAYGEITTFAERVILTSPTTGITISAVGYNFTSNFNITGTNANNYTWKNATYTLWKSDGTFFSNTTTTLAGNNTVDETFIDSFTLGDYLWDVSGIYGNDTFSNYTWSSNGNFSFIVGATIDSQTYDNTTYETADNIFSVNITLFSGVVLQAAYLYYDDVKYIGTVTSLGSDKYSMTKTISVPLSNGVSENKSFFWSFIYTSPVQRTQNTTTLNQTVEPIFFGVCNATYTTHALDIDIKEEGTFDDLNGTLEFSADYWLGDGSVKKTFTYSYLVNDTSSYDFCINPINRTFNIDDIISYTSDGYDRRDYFLNDATLSNNTMNLSLYLLSTASTDIFTFTVQDENSKKVEGAFINIQRWDVGTNNFYTVGMIKTTSDGTGIINTRLNDAWYRYQVTYGGTLYLTTEPVKEAGTTRTLEINLAETNPYEQFGDIDYSLTYDEDTNISVFTWADTTGSVAIGCLRVLKMEGNGTTEVYYSCVESSSSSLSYLIEDDGTYIIRAVFRLSDAYDNVEQVVDEIIRQGTETRFVTIGSFGQVISLLVVGTSAMLGVAIGSIPLGLGLIGIALILVNLMGWLNITSSVLYGLISIIILIGINLRRGR